LWCIEIISQAESTIDTTVVDTVSFEQWKASLLIAIDLSDPFRYSESAIREAMFAITIPDYGIFF